MLGRRGQKSPIAAPTPEQRYRWEREQRKHRTQLEDISSQRSLASGKSRTREENDLGVFLSSLPVSPGSVSQRLSGKGVVMVICADSLCRLFPSRPYWDKCPRVPPLVGEDSSQFEVSDTTWKIQSQNHLQPWAPLQHTARTPAQNIAKPFPELIKI